MVYDKKIKYLDYCENGERVRGSGFVKCELRNGSLKIEITVAGMSYDNGVTKDVILLSGDREIVLGRIGIAEGRGQYFYLCQDAGNIADTGIGYEQLSGIRIPLGASREISCRWQPEKSTAKQEASFHDAEGSQPERPAARQEATFHDAGDNQPERAAAGQEASFRDAGDSQPERSTAKQEASFHDAEGSHPERAAAGQEASFRDAERQLESPVVREETFFLHTEERQPERPMDKRAGTKQPEKKRIVLQGGNHRQEEKERGTREEVKRESMVGRLAERQWQKGGQQPNQEPKKGEEAVEEEFGRVPSVGKSIVRERRGYGSITGEKGKTERKPVVQRENKWDQLWAIYPHIRPFRDEREYLSIGPSDFVLFSSASYRMVNNSFLLHGFYNYHHLILVKVEKRGEIYYYIGVPGNYYEREKQVAIMFGFESFECAEEPAQAGDFGYYMMRTEL